MKELPPTQKYQQLNFWVFTLTHFCLLNTIFRLSLVSYRNLCIFFVLLKTFSHLRPWNLFITQSFTLTSFMEFKYGAHQLQAILAVCLLSKNQPYDLLISLNIIHILSPSSNCLASCHCRNLLIFLSFSFFTILL